MVKTRIAFALINHTRESSERLVILVVVHAMHDAKNGSARATSRRALLYFELTSLCCFLFIAEHASPADQLSLALIWNRADIARTEIFTEDQKWAVCEQYPRITIN